MTLVVGFPSGRDDQSGIELAATLARSSRQDLLMVTVVPAPWLTPVAAHPDRGFEAWSAQLGATAVAEVEALLAEHCPDVPAVARWTPHPSVPRALLEPGRRDRRGDDRDRCRVRGQLRPNASKIVRHSPVPVVVVP